ncbi:MAG: hypothetical protein IKE43_03235 [Coriobacteriales bacterium]|nr:hypothetical protein [Coriobacteriales bacterium]
MSTEPNSMNDEVKSKCANMLFAEIVSMLAAQENISEIEAKASLINSGAYDALFDFSTNLWKESPDYILAYHRGLV